MGSAGACADSGGGGGVAVAAPSAAPAPAADDDDDDEEEEEEEADDEEEDASAAAPRAEASQMETASCKGSGDVAGVPAGCGPRAIRAPSEAGALVPAGSALRS